MLNSMWFKVILDIKGPSTNFYLVTADPLILGAGHTQLKMKTSEVEQLVELRPNQAKGCVSATKIKMQIFM